MTANGQKLILEISTKDSLNTVFSNSISYQRIHVLESALIKSVDSLKSKFEKQGFLNANLDTLIKKDTIYTARFVLGRSFEKIRIHYSEKDLDKKTLYQVVSSVSDSSFEISFEKLENTLNAIVGIFEDQGDSFVEISLRDISLKENTVQAFLQIERSTLRKIDKLVLRGYVDFPKPFLTHFLKLQTGTPFNSKKLEEASKLINILPFASEIKAPEVLFTKDSTLVYLNIKKQLANRFDGLIGFSSKESGKGLAFNGYLDLALINVFNSGESFTLYWKNNGNQRQVFNVGVALPYIYNSRFSPKASLNIYKQDSTFINTRASLNLPYLIDERNSLGLSLQTESSSNLLTLESNNEIDDYNNVFYGIHYNYEILNADNLFPVKLKLYSEVLTGSRKTTMTRTQQSKLYFTGSYLWQLNFKNHLFFRNESSSLFTDDIITNELFRIGGVNSIRGFNEESIFASTFSYFTFEYRYSTNNTSYLYSITDLGYIDNAVANRSSQIYAVGLGYAFNTKFGILDLSYALGGVSDMPLNFDNSRFHLKIISFF